MNGRGFWVGCHSPCPATGPRDRCARLLGRWALPLIPIRGSQTDVSSLAHWRVPFARRVLSSDPRPHPDAGGNVSHRRERRAGHGKLEQVYQRKRGLSRVFWQGKSIVPSHAPKGELSTILLDKLRATYIALIAPYVALGHSSLHE
jgi:hypothetical protein